jgi:hypothetical protein
MEGGESLDSWRIQFLASWWLQKGGGGCRRYSLRSVRDSGHNGIQDSCTCLAPGPSSCFNVYSQKCPSRFAVVKAEQSSTLSVSLEDRKMDLRSGEKKQDCRHAGKERTKDLVMN